VPDREETPRLVDLLLQSARATRIDRRARPKNPRRCSGNRGGRLNHRRPASPTPSAHNPRRIWSTPATTTGDVVLTYFRAQPATSRSAAGGLQAIRPGTAQMYDGTLQITHPDRVLDEAGFAKLTAIVRSTATKGWRWLAASRDAQAFKAPELPNGSVQDAIGMRDLQRAVVHLRGAGDVSPGAHRSSFST